MVKNPPAMQETWVGSLGWEDTLEKGMATHSSILAWRILWTEEQADKTQWAEHRAGPPPGVPVSVGQDGGLETYILTSSEELLLLEDHPGEPLHKGRGREQEPNSSGEGEKSSI